MSPGAVYLGTNSSRALATGSNGAGWTWSTVGMTGYMPISEGISTGLSELSTTLMSAAGKKAKGWYWTADTLSTGGAEMSKQMADTDLHNALRTSTDWATVASKLADHEETLVWTPEYGYVLLSNGQAYLAQYRNQGVQDKDVQYAKMLASYWKNYSDSSFKDSNAAIFEKIFSGNDLLYIRDHIPTIRLAAQ